MKIPCPYCNSTNTYQHSDNQIYEEYRVAQASYRCNRCKKYFYRRYQLSQAEYKFHTYLKGQYTAETGYRQDLNPDRDQTPNDR